MNGVKALKIKFEEKNLTILCSVIACTRNNVSHPYHVVALSTHVNLFVCTLIVIAVMTFYTVNTPQSMVPRQFPHRICRFVKASYHICISPPCPLMGAPIGEARGYQVGTGVVCPEYTATMLCMNNGGTMTVFVRGIMRPRTGCLACGFGGWVNRGCNVVPRLVWVMLYTHWLGPRH